MKIVVTGAAGFVGRRLCEALAKAGHRVVALVHPDSMARAEEVLGSSVDAMIGVDLADLSVTRLPGSADALVTLGQARHFRQFPDRADETFAVNVGANLRLLEWALQAGVGHVVHASSGGIYGGRADSALRESDLLAVDSPLGFYLGTKLCAEIVLQNFRQYFKSTVILRPFFIYGPGQKRDMFVARMIDSVREGRPIQLHGNDGLRVNPIYVDDAVQAFGNALFLDGCHVINVAGPDILTLRALCDSIGSRIGREPVFEMKAGPAVDYVGDTTQAASKLRVQPVPFAVGLERTLASERRTAS